jgi:DNA polymerase I-like protein with 3'-5' exonuclease and polymerase domains
MKSYSPREFYNNTKIVKASIITRPEEFRQWMSNCNSVFSFDTEATSLEWLDLEIIGFSICDGKQACYVKISSNNKKKILNILAYYLQEAELVIMCNCSFDTMVLKKEGIEI